MAQYFPSDITNYSDYDVAKCYNSYDNVEGVSSSKHVPWRSVVEDTPLYTSSATQSCTNSMVKCRAGNLMNNDPYDVITRTNKTCAAPPAYNYFNSDIPEMITSFEKISTSNVSEIKNKTSESTPINTSKTNNIIDNDTEDTEDTEDREDTENTENTEDDTEYELNSDERETFKEFFKNKVKKAKKVEEANKVEKAKKAKKVEKAKKAKKVERVKKVKKAKKAQTKNK